MIENNEKIHDYVLFGYHEGHCNITDGNYVYMKAPISGASYYEYTLMPTHMQRRFGVDELQNIQLQEPFSFTKGCRTMKIEARDGMNNLANFGTKLFCLETDPKQERPLTDIIKETELANEMLRLMHEDECPTERYARFGFPAEGTVTKEEMERLHKMEFEDRIPEKLKKMTWNHGALNMYYAMKKFLTKDAEEPFEKAIRDNAEEKCVTVNTMLQLIGLFFPAEQQPMVYYFGMLASRTV